MYGNTVTNSNTTTNQALPTSSAHSSSSTTKTASNTNNAIKKQPKVIQHKQTSQLPNKPRQTTQNQRTPHNKVP